MPHLEEISHLIGVLQGTVSTGFHEVHRRMDIRDRYTAERHREVVSRIGRLEKRRNGHGGSNGEIPTIRYTLLILGFLIVGTLARLTPSAFRMAFLELAQKIIGSQLGGGG